jgi:hypothetical protein
MQRAKVYHIPSIMKNAIPHLENAAHIIESYNDFIGHFDNPAIVYLIENRQVSPYLHNPAACWLIKYVNISDIYVLYGNIGATCIINKIMTYINKMNQYAKYQEIIIKDVSERLISQIKIPILEEMCNPSYKRLLSKSAPVYVSDMMCSVAFEFNVSKKEIYKLSRIKCRDYIAAASVLRNKRSACNIISQNSYTKYHNAQYQIDDMILYLLSVKAIY